MQAEKKMKLQAIEGVKPPQLPQISKEFAAEQGDIIIKHMHQDFICEAPRRFIRPVIEQQAKDIQIESHKIKNLCKDHDKMVSDHTQLQRELQEMWQVLQYRRGKNQQDDVELKERIEKIKGMKKD